MKTEKSRELRKDREFSENGKVHDSKPTDALGRALGPNLITILPMNFG